MTGGALPAGTGEYAIVGPILFVMHNHPEMAEQTRQYPGGTPQPEVWIAIHQAWVRFDGQWVSGWCDDEYFGFRPSLLNRWKIRRAAKAWHRASAGRNAERQDPEEGLGPQDEHAVAKPDAHPLSGAPHS